MGITAVCIHRHDRRIFGYQVFAAEGFHEPLLDAVLIRAAVAYLPADLLEGCRGDRVNGVTSEKVGLDLLFAPSGLKLRHQIGRTDHVLAQAADQFECAAIHQRNVEHQVVRRVLHGDVAVIREHRLYLIEQFLPCGVLALAAGKRVEVP